MQQKWKTEMRNPDTTHIDQASTAEMLALIQKENENAVRALNAALPAIARACDAIAANMAQGGRLIYIGAGSSGRLGVLDAAECPPTFGVPAERVVGLIAGGRDCMFRAAEAAEDSGEGGVRDLSTLQLRPCDSVVGISASGNAAYVADALAYARTCGCTAVGLTSNAGSRLALEPAFPIVTDTGAEVITGSTRMKAGSAQKMVLNMLSTCVMIKTGKVYENLMINLRPTNRKLTQRMVGIVSELCGADEETSRRLLEENGFRIRPAVEAWKRQGSSR